MKIRVYRQFDVSLREKWEYLEQQIETQNIYFSFLWASTWWEVFGKNFQPFIIVLEDGDAVRGIAPLMLSRPKGIPFSMARNLNFIGTGLSDYHDFLLAPGFEKEVVKDIILYLHDQFNSWSLMRLRHFPEDSKTPALLRSSLKELGFEDDFSWIQRPTVPCPFIPLHSNWESYYGSVSKNLRSDVNRKLNKLKRTFQFEFEKVEPRSQKEYESYLDAFIAINRKRWEQKKGRNIFSFESPEHQRFYRAVTDRFSQKGWTLFYVLRLNGRPVAYIYCFKYHGKIYHWNTAFEPEYFGYSIGKVLHRLAIENAFRSGYREFDFMRGDEEYKLKWTNRVRVNSEVFILDKKNLFSKYSGMYYLRLKPYLEKSGIVEWGYRAMNRWLK